MAKTMVALRVDPHDLQEIDRRAQAAGLNRTAYMVRAAVGAQESLEDRMAVLEARLAELERLAGAEMV